MKILSILVAVFSILLFSCQKNSVSPASQERNAYASELKGSWKLSSVLMGDIMDLPCGMNTPSRGDLTLIANVDSASTSGEKLIINGQSAVNLYFASLEVLSYNQETLEGTLKISTLGSTKIAGTNEMNACESRFFNILSSAKDYRFVKSNEGKVFLHLGTFSKNPMPTYDAGTYLIFEKVK
jgi:META domain